MKTTIPKETCIFSYCDHCGFAIYEAKDAVRVHATRDVIHTECWADYSCEHMFELVQSVCESNGFDRGG
ncbi:MAG: hypothetical protein IJ489_06865 [Clostridia bacterium]|nr:hypothetical protein [Clostridia bacterium]